MEKQPSKSFTEASGFGKTVDAKTDVADTDDYEFAFTSVESNPGALTGSPADEIFSNGRILPVYPVFNQNLVADRLDTSGEEKLAEGMARLALPFEKHLDLRSGSVSSSVMSSEAEDIEDSQGSEAEYCIWTPRSAPQSPDRWQKSSSTGSEALEFRRFRLRDLVVGRSRSDGKENLFFLPEAVKETKRSLDSRPNPSSKQDTEVEKAKSAKGKGRERTVKELDVVTAHRIYYSKRPSGTRRSFLPYRQDLLVGFFGHGNRHPV